MNRASVYSWEDLTMTSRYLVVSIAKINSRNYFQLEIYYQWWIADKCFVAKTSSTAKLRTVFLRLLLRFRSGADWGEYILQKLLFLKTFYKLFGYFTIVKSLIHEHGEGGCCEYLAPRKSIEITMNEFLCLSKLWAPFINM